jgi:hypothetical protein
MKKEDFAKYIYDIFGEGIVFDEKKFYNQVKDYLDDKQKMHGAPGKGCMIYLTNHVNPNQVPYSIILARNGWNNMDNSIGVVHIQKDHPLGDQIKKGLGELLKK